MTQIQKKNKEKMITEQTSLLSDKPENDEVADRIQDLKLWVSGDKMENGYLFPRFGLLSLKMRNTPMYAYDHPALMNISNTAFTDGVHVFISADFLNQLDKEEELANGMEQGATPLILHELMHMLMNHNRRLRQFPKDVANEAEDLSINAKLQMGFSEIKWVSSLREVGLAFRQGDVERYAKLAEETIARELIEKRQKNQKQNKQQQQQQGGNSQSSSQSSGKGGKGAPSNQNNQSGNGNDEGNDNDGSNGDQNDDNDEKWDNNHTVTLEELIETLQENNLSDILDKLDLPHSADEVEKIGEIEEQVRLKDIDAIQKAAAQKSQMGGKYPGGHIVDSCAELIKGFTEGKLQWRLGLKSFMFGDGMRYRYTESEAADLFYISPEAMNIDDPIYVGTDLPHKPEEIVLCLIDTSGSVDSGQLKAFLSEIFNLKRENAGVGDCASEVVVISADTVVRGQPIEITEDNVDELMNSGIGLSGRGGTDLANDLRQTMKLPMFEEKKISSVVFFTDLCDTPPKKEDFKSDIPLCFVTLPHTMSEEFARAVKDFARVYPIEEGQIVDLDQETHLDTPVNTKKRGSKF